MQEFVALHVTMLYLFLFVSLHCFEHSTTLHKDLYRRSQVILSLSYGILPDILIAPFSLGEAVNDVEKEEGEAKFVDVSAKRNDFKAD